jgi:hypothetical protein
MVSLPTFEEQHALNSALNRLKKEPSGRVRPLRHEQLDEERFPNGKIWWSYPVRACHPFL